MGVRSFIVRAKTLGAVLVCGLLLLAPAGTASAVTDEEETCYVIASYRLFWKMDASFEAYAYWSDMFESGEPYSALPDFLASQDPWLGVTVDGLYRQALDRGADASGRAHWVERLQGGVLVNALGSEIYGSGEFYQRAGSTPEGFVTELYERILHRIPDPAGLSHWVNVLGSTSRGAVAASFFASPESRADRVTGLYKTLLGRAPDPGGLAYWQNRLLTVNDVRLAVMLASSSEFFGRTTLPHGDCLNPL